MSASTIAANANAPDANKDTSDMVLSMSFFNATISTTYDIEYMSAAAKVTHGITAFLLYSISIPPKH
jgi:hypothetical protein